MGHRLQRWRALDWRQRLRLVGCSLGLALVHASLALAGYARTRAMIERFSNHPYPRAATAAERADARDLARMAAIAGHHGAIEATCLRRSLLLHGWLRWRGLRPVLHLGVKDRQGPFQAHAWVELDGQRLLPGDEGYRPFDHAGSRPQGAGR